LNIFLVNDLGVPIQAAEISYALYFVDKSMGEPGVEVLIGNPNREPVNPSLGEYYAAIQVPFGAQAGDYRIRWTFRRALNEEYQTVVQEFAVVVSDSPNPAGQKLYSACERDLIDKLRILLRDNCVGGEEVVRLQVEGETILVRMDELWEACTSGTCGKENLRRAFQNGTLLVESVSPTGEVEWKKVVHVQRAEIGPESVWRAETEHGTMTLTGGHRVFTSPVDKQEMESLVVGQEVQSIKDGTPCKTAILSISRIEDRQYMYDLTAEDWHNFVLHNSKVVISNSPDRNYRFRPPEQESVIGKYNRVFGYVWEDYELYTYLQLALDYWNMMPPETESISTLNQLCQQKPVWRTAILWGAIAHAMAALTINWIHDEFDYSIGGISLSIDKSSKYQGMKDNAEQQFEKAYTEGKRNTVKYIRGLQQPKYGFGVRSSFGPNVGRGVLSPRNFV
jgi:hypothetical protein